MRGAVGARSRATAPARPRNSALHDAAKPGDARRRLGDKDARGSTGVHAAISRLVPEHSARRRDSVASSISELLENVTYVSAGYAVKRSSYVPSDPYFSTQTHYIAIDLEVAWDLSAGNPDIAVQ